MQNRAEENNCCWGVIIWEMGGSASGSSKAAPPLATSTAGGDDEDSCSNSVGIIDNAEATGLLLPYSKLKPLSRTASNHRHHRGGGPMNLMFGTRIRKAGARLGLGLGSAIKVSRISSFICLFSLLLLFSHRIGPLMGWNNNNHHPPPPAATALTSANSRGGYTVLINTWKRNSLLKRAVAHYATCSLTDAIHVVWSESDPPSGNLKTYIRKILLSQSQTSRKLTFRFELHEEDNLNNRFKPIAEPQSDAIFSVDDDVIVPCRTLDLAFTVWRTAPNAMVGFVPRMHWLHEEKDSVAYYKYGGWWSVWWMGTYSMILSKAAFFHRKYLDMYTYDMPSSIHDYVTRERNCEDIAMSFLVANATGAPPIWVKGKVHEIGSFGISSLKGHNERRNKCLNYFISLYGSMPLVETNMKAVDAQKEWLW